MRRKAIMMLFPIVFLLLCACSGGDLVIEKKDRSDQPAESEASGEAADTAVRSDGVQVLEPGEQFPVTSGNRSGTLKVSAENAEIYSGFDDVPFQLADVVGDNIVDGENYDAKTGSLSPDYAFVKVHIKVQNDNAVSGEAGAADYDTETFRLEALGNLNNHSFLVYADKHDESVPHPFAYKLPQGETMEADLYFLSDMRIKKPSEIRFENAWTEDGKHYDGYAVQLHLQ